jgi:uncharacterized protein
MIKRWLTALVVASLACCVHAEISVPVLKTRVTDLTGTLSAEQKGSLEQRLAAFEAKKGSQIAVLMLPTTRPEEIEQFSIRVAEAWKIGRKGTNDGVILLVAKDDRRLRIEVGYGLEGAIPDATAKRVISETITPRFKAGDFYGGVSAGVDRLIRLVDGEKLPPRSSAPSGPSPQSLPESASEAPDEFLSPFELWMWTIAFVLPLGALHFLRRRIGHGPAAILMGAIYFMAVLFLSNIVAAVFMGFMALFLTAVKIDDRPLGGSFFSSGSSGGGSSGWGGGGGSFGGGGASGDWS